MTYTEDALVEQPAIKLFEGLDWESLNGWEEEFGEDSLLGRENRGDVVLLNRLCPALEKLNPAAPKLAIDEAIEALTCDLSSINPLRLLVDSVHSREGMFIHARQQ